jgi:hypothetical protein
VLPPAEAFEAMRSGIVRFNACVGIENTDHSGYHETLTRFWSEIIRAFVNARNFPNAYAAVREAVNEYGDNRDLYRQFYDYDIVSDSNARREWIHPNRVR